VNTRDRILDAAYNSTVAAGWGSVTMAGLGDAAGVSRQSVYNEFGNKQQVATALINRELLRFLEAVDAGIAQGTTPTESMAEAVGAVSDLAEHNPLLRAVLSAAAGSPSPLLPLLTSASQPLIDTAAARVRRALDDKYPDRTNAATPAVVDAIVRLTLSHVVQPGRPQDLQLAVRALMAHTGSL
jgi:AcrR family transcriptional regulator